ncbi:hypothetical protein OG874_18170 [Nocardia sp. NBC_00565]|uniref:alpha/beta hydrolase family esterase n=1 Tax=Nocardia sp. NBC_00565 TaxID=2975993 RepID=UPI002E81A8D2|nr:hypothetical protein [Nocardia sp. NBC_00565]WUC06908.1 hypothetical protein OG874_18170 [Nocardia sp. NBC_00565]
MSDDLVADELTIDGRIRTFTVRPPRDRDVPLVLVLHGNLSGDDPRSPGLSMYEWTSFAAHADEWGIAVGYPDGCRGCWADGRGVTAADEAGVDDVTFLRALIDWCADRFGTHPDRTIVAGISNGAFMSHRLALEASDQVAVFAAVAGGLPAALRNHRPTHAVSAMLMNGTADQLVPITGGHSRRVGTSGELRGRTLGLVDSAAHWRAIDSCVGDGATIGTGQSNRHTVDGGVGGAAVSAWSVFDGGHTWPGTPVPDEWAGGPNSAVSLEFDAAEEIYRFARPLLVPAAARKL